MSTMASARDPMDEHNLPDKWRQVHISALGSSTCFLLARELDPPATTLSENGNLKNFEGLSELMGFDGRDSQQFAMNSKTRSLLEAYGAKGPQATIGRLWDFLLDLERTDIMADAGIRARIEKDINTYYQRQQELIEQEKNAHRTPAARVPAIPNIPGGLSSGGGDRYDEADRLADEFHNITVNEVVTGEAEMFDAFVSYSDKDINFVKEMIRMLEEVHKLKLCVNARDLVIGTSYYTVTAKIIAERCRKVLIVMSPSFLQEPECDFQIKFAHALSPGSRSKKMVPILVAHCDIPLILKHVTLVDHTKADLIEWFWYRLAKSLLAMVRAEPDFSFEQDDDTISLAEFVFDFDHDPAVRSSQRSSAIESSTDPCEDDENECSEAEVTHVLEGRNYGRYDDCAEKSEISEPLSTLNLRETSNESTDKQSLEDSAKHTRKEAHKASPKISHKLLKSEKEGKKKASSLQDGAKKDRLDSPHRKPMQHTEPFADLPHVPFVPPGRAPPKPGKDTPKIKKSVFTFKKSKGT